jgi:hypothetical protein
MALLLRTFTRVEVHNFIPPAFFAQTSRQVHAGNHVIHSDHSKASYALGQADERRPGSTPVAEPRTISSKALALRGSSGPT